MKRLRTATASYRLAPLGGLLLILAIGAFVTAEIGPASAQTPAFAIGVFVALLILAGGLSGGALGRSTKGLPERRAEYGARERDVHDEGTGAGEEDAAAWQRERELRERKL